MTAGLSVLFILAIVALCVLTILAIRHLSNIQRRELRWQRRQHLTEQKMLQLAVDEHVADIGKDLKATSIKLNNYIEKELTKALHDNISTYRKNADTVKSAAINIIDQASKDFDHQQRAIDERVEAEVARRKEALAQNIEANFADIIEAYVRDLLSGQPNIDDQTAYIIQELENHKDEIIKDLSGVR